MQPLRLAPEVFHLFVRDGSGLLKIVLHAEVVLVEGRLANNNVKVESTLRHAPAGWGRAVALRVHEKISVGLRDGVKPFRYQGRGPIKGRPLLPTLQLEPKGCAWAHQRHDVNPQRVDEI